MSPVQWVASPYTQLPKPTERTLSQIFSFLLSSTYPFQLQIITTTSLICFTCIYLFFISVYLLFSFISYLDANTLEDFLNLTITGEVLLSVREAAPVGWMGWMEIYFKGLPHAIVGADSSKSVWQVSRSHAQAGVDVQSWGRISSFLGSLDVCS